MQAWKKTLALLLIVLILMGNFTGLAGAETAKIEIAGSNMTLGNALEVNFMAKKADLPKAGCTAVITQELADGTVRETEVPQAAWGTMSIYHKISVGVAAKEMADPLSIEIFDADGNVLNAPYTSSVRDYAGRALAAGSTADEVRALMVDMLNYGASAQKNFKYNTADLANNALTAEQAALATDKVPCVNGQVKGKNCYGSNLTLGDSILLNVMFSGLKNKSLTGMYAVISFEGYEGVSKEFRVESSDFEKYNSDVYKVVVDQIVLADARQPVTVTLYDADGTVYGTASDSVESYVARAEANNADTYGLYANIMKFAVSAYDYLVEDPAEPEEPETPDEPELPIDSALCGILTCAETGEPLADAQIKVFNVRNELVDTVYTIDDGSFTVAVEAGTYTLKISANGFDLCEVHCVAAGSDKTDVSTSLEPLADGTLEGVITDEVTGELLPGIVLEVYNAAGRWVMDVSTNEKGVYRTLLAPGTYTLKTAKERNSFRSDDEYADDYDYLTATSIPVPYETVCTVESNETTIVDMSLTCGSETEATDCLGRPGTQWYHFYDRKQTMGPFEAYEPGFRSFGAIEGDNFANMDEEWANIPEADLDDLVDFLYGYHRGNYDYVLTVNGEESIFSDLQDLVDSIDFGKGVLVEAYICEDAIYVVVINTFIGKVMAVDLAKGTVTIGGDNDTITIDNDYGFGPSDVDETTVLFKSCKAGIHDVEVVEPVTATVTSAWADGNGDHFFLADGRTYEYAETFGTYLGGVMIGEEYSDLDLEIGRKHDIYTDKNGYVMWTEWTDDANTEIVVIDGDSWVSDGRYITADGENYKINTCDFIYFEEGAPIRTVDTTYDFNAGQIGYDGTDDDILAWVDFVDDDEVVFMPAAAAAQQSYETIYLEKGKVKIGSNNYSSDVRDYLVNDDTQIIVRVSNYFGEEGDDFTYLYFDGIDEIDANYIAEDFQYFLDNECDQDGSGRYYAYIYVDATYAKATNRAFILRSVGTKTMQLTNGKIMSGGAFEAIVDGKEAIVFYGEGEDRMVEMQLKRTGEEVPVVIKSDMARIGWTLDGLPVWVGIDARPDDEVLTTAEDPVFHIDGGVLSWNQGDEVVVQWEGIRMDPDASIWIAEVDRTGRYSAGLFSAEEFNDCGVCVLDGYIWAVDAVDENGLTDGRYDYLYAVADPDALPSGLSEAGPVSANTAVVLIDGDSWESSDEEDICDFVYFEEGAPIRTVDTTYDFNADQIGVHGTDEDILAWIEYADGEINSSFASVVRMSYDTVYLEKGKVKIGSNNYSHDVRDYLVNDDTQIIVRVPDYFGSEEDAFTYLYFDGIDEIDANYMANDFQYFLDNECGQNGTGRFYSHIYIDATYEVATNRAFVLRSLGSKSVKLDNGRIMGGAMYEAIINGVRGVVVYENDARNIVNQQLNREGREIPVMIKSNLVLSGWTLDDMPVWSEVRPDDEVLTTAEEPDFLISGGVLSWNQGDQTVAWWEGIRLAPDCAIWIATPNRKGEFEAELVSQEAFNDYRAEYGWALVDGYCWAVDAPNDTGRTDGQYDYLLIAMEPDYD